MAQHGNGTAAHIYTRSEARKVLVEAASSTLYLIAQDAKIQVEFNPKTIADYRLMSDDAFGHSAEFICLTRLAQSVSTSSR